MTKVTGRDVVEHLKQFIEEYLDTAEEEEGRRGSDDYEHEIYVTAANGMGFCQELVDASERFSVLNFDWEVSIPESRVGDILSDAMHEIVDAITDSGMVLGEHDETDFKRALTVALESQVEFEGLIMMEGVDQGKIESEDPQLEIGRREVWTREAYQILRGFIEGVGF